MKFNRAFGENSRQWPDDIRVSRTATIVDWSYGYDAGGNVTRIYDGVPGRVPLSMSYNGVNELRSVSGPWGSANIGYDSVGNITSYQLGATSRIYSYSGNKLTRFNGNPMSYDSLGNVVNDGNHSYDYNLASNLTCVDCAAAAKIEYAYDGNNRRVWRRQ